MILYMGNKGGVDIFNNWSIAGNTRAVLIQFAYVRELKEAGILKIVWIKGTKNCADLFTKMLMELLLKLILVSFAAEHKRGGVIE